MTCGCGCNGAPDGCGSIGLKGFGAIDTGITYISPAAEEIDGWLKGMMPMILVGGIGLFLLWRR